MTEVSVNREDLVKLVAQLEVREDCVDYNVVTGFVEKYGITESTWFPKRPEVELIAEYPPRVALAVICDMDVLIDYDDLFAYFDALDKSTLEAVAFASGLLAPMVSSDGAQGKNRIHVMKQPKWFVFYAEAYRLSLFDVMAIPKRISYLNGDYPTGLEMYDLVMSLGLEKVSEIRAFVSERRPSEWTDEDVAKFKSYMKG